MARTSFSRLALLVLVLCAPAVLQAQDTASITGLVTDQTGAAQQTVNNLPIENRDSPGALFTQQPAITLDGAVTGARVDQDQATLDGLES